MTLRKKIPNSTQAEVLVQSRRRCCLCFGLNRDDAFKNGQIAHLDRDINNNSIENLAFLCLEHHNEYDSRTSQSKGLVRAEIERYREELAYHFGSWSTQLRRDDLLNFLAFQIDLDVMAKAAVKVGESVVWYGEKLAFQVLTTNSVDYCDADLYVPHLFALDHFASWGWLTYTEEEREVEGGTSVFIETVRKSVCNEVASRILKHRHDRGENNDQFLNLTDRQEWKDAEPNE
ncbi:MAG: hypothetical protein Q8O92_14340 [Candidatus Latescibacter sp.]|nr:hypothetical protein [Candidatus Latescibacter sp.]